MKYDFLAPYFKLSDPLEKMYVTQGFGVNGVQLYEDLGLDGHNGIDLRARYIPTYATIDAQVISSGQDYTGGRFVKYRPDDVYIAGS
jgi:murein DD-endopeptidase MepM/ murein hydrolase activator NlpD